jgi:hypothetical protein
MSKKRKAEEKEAPLLKFLHPVAEEEEKDPNPKDETPLSEAEEIIAERHVRWIDNIMSAFQRQREKDDEDLSDDLATPIGVKRTKTPDPSFFNYSSLSLNDQSQIYAILVRYCVTKEIYLGSCNAFIYPWLKIASETIMYLNKKHGSFHRSIPLGLTKKVASFLWPIKDSILWNQEKIGYLNYTVISLGWCDNDKGDSTKHRHYAIDNFDHTKLERRTPCHVFVLSAWSLAADRVLSAEETVSSITLNESGYHVRLCHLTDELATTQTMSAQAQMLVWKYGGFHHTEGFPAPLQLFDPIDLDHNFELY